MTGKAAQAGTGTNLPAHETVYRDLRARILYGDLAPGQAVTIQGLVAQSGAGMTPVREAIRRLTAEGALVFQGNRRVTVPRLTAANVDELIFARQAIEPQLMVQATRHAGAADLDRLAREDAALDAAIASGDVVGYLRHNHGFHAMLYELAQAPILAALAEGLWLRFGPSLRVVCGRMGTQNLPDRHKQALEAMRAGDEAGAAQAIREDVLQGMEQVRQAIAAEGANRRFD